MKFILILSLLFVNAAFASSKQEQEVFKAKVNYEQKAYQLKISREKASQITITKSLDINQLLNFGANAECVEWVYQGPLSREQAAEACRGVYLMECLEFVYKGPSDRAQSAMACKGVTDMECVNEVFKGSSNREEAARACGQGDRPDRPDGC